MKKKPITKLPATIAKAKPAAKKAQPVKAVHMLRDLAFTVCRVKPASDVSVMPVAVLDISDEAALIEQAAKSMEHEANGMVYGRTVESLARQVLESLGIIAKRKARK